MAKRRRRPSYRNVSREYEESGRSVQRSEETFVFDGKVSTQQGVFGRNVEQHMTDENGNPLIRNFRFLLACDSGHVLGDQNRIIGRCYICHGFLCGSRGCAYSCMRCGKVCCRWHSAIFLGNDKEPTRFYCKACKWWFYVDRLFGFGT